MNTITRERVANLLQFNSEGSDCQANAEEWEVHELARIALASLEAEAVGEFYHEKQGGWYQISEGDKVPDNRRIKLYIATPAPVSVPTFEEWCKRTEQKPVGWVRDAMLKNE